MELDELRIFARVAELASFSRAAEQLGLAKGRVSTAVRQLEVRVGARLLQRTTRNVRLTPDGERFLERSKELLTEAEQLHAMFRPAASGLTGRLRIDLPNSLARDLIVPRLPEFLAAHPQLEIGISTTDRRVDLVHEGFDCVLRVGALADLARHRIVHYTSALASRDAVWDYRDPIDGVVRALPMRADVTVNGTDAYDAAAIAGLGIYQAPAIHVRALVASGHLVEVMPEHVAPAMPVSLLYAHRRQLAPRVQAVMAWLQAVVAPRLDETP